MKDDELQETFKIIMMKKKEWIRCRRSFKKFGKIKREINIPKIEKSSTDFL
jgi:uncharacterized protein YqgQ